MTATHDALGALLDADPAYRRACLQLAITKRVIQIRTGLPKLSAPHAAAAMTEAQWQDIQAAHADLADWIARVRQLHGNRTLRIVR